jgi:hypothetical protein
MQSIYPAGPQRPLVACQQTTRFPASGKLYAFVRVPRTGPSSPTAERCGATRLKFLHFCSSTFGVFYCAHGPILL